MGLTLLLLFILLIMATIVANGGAGDTAKYYYIKGIYRIFHPKNKPLGEIVIDLKQGHEFIINNTYSNRWLHPFGWWSSEKKITEQEREQEERFALHASAPGPFEYLKVKIIWEDETTLTIDDARVIIIHFKDYRNPESRIKQPTVRGINDIQIFCIEGHPILENGRFLERRQDYAFALAQHQKLASLFTELSFVRDIRADDHQKNIINKRVEEFGRRKYLEYKTWSKGNFELTLILELSDGNYSNSIYISPKDKL